MRGACGAADLSRSADDCRRVARAIAVPCHDRYSRDMKPILALILSSLAAAPLAAHPHIFIDTGFELILDEAGHMTHVRVSWQYDDFYSLLITEDMALDTDLMALREQLATLDAQTDPQDAGMPDIGAQMAGSMIVICGAS